MEQTTARGLLAAAARLSEAARRARDGDGEAARACAADAVVLLRDVPDYSSIPDEPIGASSDWSDRWLRSENAEYGDSSIRERLLFGYRRERMTGDWMRLRMVAASARVNERARIARELHDTLLQGVQGLMLRLQVAAECVKHEPEQAHRLIEQALARADAVLEEGRDRVNDLRSIDESPVDLSQIFLRAAEYAGPHSAKVRVQVEGSVRALQPLVREETQRIGIEAISNALRHAQASSIDVAIFYQRRRFALRVSDDGVGIDPAMLNSGRKRHFGLTGIRERARSLHGELSIASRPGGGTDIEFVLSARIAYAAKGRGCRPWVRRYIRGKPTSNPD